MVKKKGVTKVKKISEDCNPSLTYAVVAVLVVALLLLPMVDVGQGLVGSAIVTGNVAENIFGNFINRMFGGEGSTTDEMVSKYLLLFMLVILIYSILSTAEWPDRDALRWLLAIPISFLAIAYITPAELLGLMSLYSATGLALSAVLPFMVMLFFNTQLLASKKINVGKILLQWFMWGVFSLFLGYRMVMLFIRGEADAGVVTVLFVAAFLISLAATIWNKHYVKMVFNLRKDLKLETSQRESLDLALAGSQKRVREAQEQLGEFMASGLPTRS